MPSELLESLFPNLKPGEYQITSPQDDKYNCIAWAVGDTHQWWEPSSLHGFYWPPGVGKEYNLASYSRVFAIHGYTPCDTSELEQGYEKIAIYVDSMGIPTHAARQKESGVWTSKLGELEDIEHTTLSALEGPDYGAVAQIMKRHRLGNNEGS